MSFDHQHQLDRTRTRRNFERAAQSYDSAAIVQREIAERLLQRLALIRLQPERIVDLGCGTGMVTADLLKRYPQADIIGLDLAETMVQRTLQHRHWLKRPQGICADVHALPLAQNSVDMLISNLMLQWCNDLLPVFKQCAACLREEGLLTFTTFGPDTLKELRSAWAQVDGYPHVSQFTDMHDVGDALLQAGFRDPVVDMEIITLTYEDVRLLLHDLKAIGANNTTAGRQRGLMGKQRLQALINAYEQYRQADGLLPVTYEVIYGHAWSANLEIKAQPIHYIR